MSIDNELYLKNCRLYFEDKYDDFINTLDKEPSRGFYINSFKGNASDILKYIDFDYKKSGFNDYSYYHFNDHISNSIAYDLGLIYSQGIESSFSSSLFDFANIKLIVDMCAAPGGKSINYINKYKDALIISNDVSYKRSLLINNNFERLGIDNAIITNLDTIKLSDRLKGACDLVILDAPCSGEGMARKTQDIFDSYSDKYIENLSSIQKDLLENAYNLLNNDSYLVYSTCAYSFKEDEENINYFLDKHKDIELINIDCKDNATKLKGTIKLSFLNNTEGQFIAIIHKLGSKNPVNIKLSKNIKNKLVDSFIKDNLNINEYYLYNIDNRFYMSFKPLIDLKSNIVREGIYLGDIENNRFIPNHFMYRANSLKGLYKYEYELSLNEYHDYIKGLEIKIDNLSNNFYHLTYNNFSVGFGKVVNGVIKNKYPKGLRK